MAEKEIKREETTLQKPIAIIVPDNTFGKEKNNLFFDWVFSLPLSVQVIVQRSMTENGGFPLRYLEKENALPLHGDGFIKIAKKKAEGKRILVFKKPHIPDTANFIRLASSKSEGLLFKLTARIVLGI